MILLIDFFLLVVKSYLYFDVKQLVLEMICSKIRW